MFRFGQYSRLTFKCRVSKWYYGKNPYDSELVAVFVDPSAYYTYSGKSDDDSSNDNGSNNYNRDEEEEYRDCCIVERTEEPVEKEKK